MYYEVLVRLSTGYPPVDGRLHTCYSPIRRSPPKYCYLVLPLDLHVLGLSLAFILSQDQTLRCKKLICSQDVSLVYRISQCVHYNIHTKKELTRHKKSNFPVLYTTSSLVVSISKDRLESLSENKALRRTDQMALKTFIQGVKIVVKPENDLEIKSRKKNALIFRAKGTAKIRQSFKLPKLLE